MEKLIKSSNGQWILAKGAPKGVDKDKWDSCVEDVKAKGTAESPHAVCTSAMAKEDVSIAPTPSNPRKGGEGVNEMAKDEDSEMMFSQLESIAHHVKEIRESMKPSEESPDWVKSKITEAAKQLSDVAHYIQGQKTVTKADYQKPTSHDRDLAQRHSDIKSDAKAHGMTGKQPGMGQKEIDRAVRDVEAKLPSILKPRK